MVFIQRTSTAMNSVQEQELDGFIVRGRKILKTASLVQTELPTTVSEEDIWALCQDYQDWYARCRVLLPDDLRFEFDQAYLGQSLATLPTPPIGIKTFISDPASTVMDFSFSALFGRGRKEEQQRTPAYHYQYSYENYFEAPCKRQIGNIVEFKHRLLTRGFAPDLPEIISPSLDAGLRHTIASITSRIFTNREIDGLFLRSGARDEWKKIDSSPDPIVRKERVDRWFRGLAKNAPDYEYPVAISVSELLLDNLEVSREEKSRIRTSLEKIDGKPRQKSEMESIRLHPAIVDASQKLFDDGHYRQALLDATLALNAAVQKKSGLLELDGIALMTQAFGNNKGLLRFDDYKDDQVGYMNLFMGVSAVIRNSRAHVNPPIDADPNEVVEMLALLSFLFRALDSASRSEGV